MNKTLVTLKFPIDHLAPIAGLTEIVMPDYSPAIMPRKEVLSAVAGCTAIINQGELRVDDELLEAAGPQLKIVANVAMGIDNLDRDALRRHGVEATNTPAAFVESTADLTLGLILAAARRIVVADQFVRSGEWEKVGFEPVRWEGTRLLGKTLGLIGYGKIAQAVERRAIGFGVEVIHTRNTSSDHPGFRTMPDLLAQSDIVVVLVPHTPQTEKLINAETISAMKPGAMLINVARGKVADESAIVDALKSGHLGAAGLDVFEAEPTVHPELLKMENVVLTPHLGGSTVDDRRGGRLEAAENVARILKGEPVITSVL